MKIILSYFITTVIITLCFLYIVYPKAKVIVKYPDINKEISDKYIDDNNICYKYHRKQVSCSAI